MENERSASLIGDWVGGFDLGAGRQVVNRARFTMGAEGLGGTLDFENEVALILREIVNESSRAQFGLPRGSATLMFRGHLSNDTIVGNVEQDGTRGTFDLVRVGIVDPSLIADYTGTYRISPDRDIFVGDLLGSPQFTYYDFRTGRVGALYPESDTTFFAGPEFFVPFPKDVRITFERDRAKRVVGLTWHPNGEVDQFAARISLQSTEVTFHNGEAHLRGSLLLPSGDGPHPAVVLIHGSGPQTRAHVRIHAEYFARRGIAALAYDKRGTGASTGDWRKASYEDLAADALAGARFLQQMRGIATAQVGLCGSSQGGWIAPLAATQAADLAFVVLVAGPAVSVAPQNLDNAEYSLRAQGLSEDEISEAVTHIALFNELWRSGQGWEQLRRSANRGRQTRWSDYAWPGPDQPPSPNEIGGPDDDRDPVAVLDKVRCPILALFGGRDTVVPVEGNLNLMQRALATGGNRDNSIVVFPRANHLFLVGAPDGRLARCTHFIPDYLEIVGDWILRRVGTPA